MARGAGKGVYIILFETWIIGDGGQGGVIGDSE
jgi:hypothetical protein